MPLIGLVRGGTVVTPHGAYQADVVIEAERVAALVPPGSAAGGAGRGAALDAGGLLVFPGMVDAHVHFQEPGREEWEGFGTGSAAAAAGGVTTVVDMPIDSDPPTVSAAAVAVKAERARRHSLVDVALWGGLIPSSVPDLAAMATAGVAGFKAFACPSGWDEFPPVDELSLAAGLAAAARLDLPVAVHCERHGHGVADEVDTVRWASRLAAAAGARLNVVHVSSAEAVDEARRWPAVSVETCPHYLLLDETDAAAIGPNARCFPPLRDAARRRALWQRVLDGSVDTVASDHSPCTPARRASWAGVDGVGLTLALLLSAGLAPVLLAALATEAARRLRLAGKGLLAPGYDADLALVDPAAPWTVTAESRGTRHGLSAWIGRPLTARVVATTVRGRLVFSSEEGPVAAGQARVLRPAATRPST